jgi:hypothetical protein
MCQERRHFVYACNAVMFNQNGAVFEGIQILVGAAPGATYSSPTASCTGSFNLVKQLLGVLIDPVLPARL